MKILPILVQLVRETFNLPDNSVWIGYQNKIIPPNTDASAAVTLISAETIGSMPSFDPIADEDILEVYFRGAVQIDIFSRSNYVLENSWRLMSLINSPLSIKLQEEHQFSLSRLSTAFTNASSLIGPDQINRFNCRFNVSWSERISTASDIYEKFSIECGNEADLQQIKIDY